VSFFFAKAIQTAARTTNAAVHGLAQRNAAQAANTGRRGDGKPGCTPCEAMARRRAAQQAIRGISGR
jgi:hypothetical protein